MSSTPPSNRFVSFLRSVMGNAAWDAIKNLAKLAYENWPLLVLGMGVIASSIAAWINRLRGIPSDLLGVLTVFAITVAVGFLSFIIGRMRDRRRPATSAARPDTGSSQTSETVTLEIHDSLHGCPDQRLHQLAENDRPSAWRLVKFEAVTCELHLASDGPPPFIIFTFAIFNLTLLEVSIRDEVAGAIYFTVPGHDSWKLRRALSMEYNEAKQVLFRGRRHFKVRQDLTREDADYIRGNIEVGSFKMDELTIRISGDGLDDPRLDTRFSVKGTEIYRPDLTDFLN